MEAVKACHEVVHELGAPRIFTSLKINSRTDRDQALEERRPRCSSCWLGGHQAGMAQQRLG